MPDFIDMFIELKKEKQEHDKQAKPNAGADSRAFFDNLVEGRKIDRKNKKYRSLLSKVELSIDSIEQSVRASQGKDAEKLIEGAGSDTFFKKEVIKQIKQNEPKLFEEYFTRETEDEQKNKIRSEISDGQKASVLNTLIGEGKISQKYIDNVKIRNIQRILLAENKDPEKGILFLTEIKKYIDPKVSEQIGKEAANYKDVLERPDNEKLARPYEDRVQELKDNIPQGMDEKKKAEYLKALDFAVSHLTVVDDELHNEMTSREQQGVQTIEARHSEWIVENKGASFKGGKYNDLHENINCRASKYDIVKEDKKEIKKELLDERVTMSDSTKKGIRAIIQKMDEMKLMDYGVEKNGESLFKVYGFNKLLKEKTDLEEALKNGDPDAIIKASNAYKKTWEDLQELYKLAKDHLSNDELFFPGNMDSVRNRSIPFEFTGDLMRTAQINAIFLMYATVKQNNMDLEAYLENPTGNLYKSTLDSIENDCFEKACQGLNFDETLDFLTLSGNYAMLKQQFTLNHISYGINRSLLGPSMLEKNPDLRDDNIVLADILEKQLNVVLNGQEAKYGFLESGISGRSNVPKEQERENVYKTLENLMVAADKDRNLNACLGGMPETDMYGNIIGESFDADKYINEEHMDYDGIIDRTQKIHNKCTVDPEDYRGATGIKGVGKDEFLELAQKTIGKILAVHEAERGNPGYDKLEQEFLSLSKKLSEKADPALKDRMQKAEKDYMARFSPEMVSQDVSMDDITAEGDRAQINVHFGSRKYDDALNSLKNLNNEIKAFKEMPKDKDYDAQRKALESIQKGIEKSERAIDAYMERKRRQGKLGDKADEKSKKRIAVMRKAAEYLKRISRFVDDTNLIIDKKEVASNNSAYEIDQIKEMEKLASESKGLDKLAAETTANAYRALQDITEHKGPMNERDQKIVKNAFAAIAFREALANDMRDVFIEKIPATRAALKKQIESIASNEAFLNEISKLDREKVAALMNSPEELKKLEKQVSKAMNLDRAKQMDKKAEKKAEKKDKKIENKKTVDHGKK
ncbi:MAG: hypothetical protein K5929_09165 [Lachnospiraceae bacterium]|nr:hypothetical protein [Lachnospiraceae bacterium]